MALKGKRKSGSRGSQGRRRPAAAPRPAPVPVRGLPWYHTNGGRLVIAALIAVSVGLAWWAISSAQSRSDRLETRREALDDYTGRIRTLSQSIGEPAAQMAAVVPTPDRAGLGDLRSSSGGWARAFAQAQTSLIETFPSSAALQRANGLFQGSLQLYESAARTYQLVPRAEGNLQPDLLARAAAQRDQAAALWTAAVAYIDASRTAADMDPSGLAVPGSDLAAQATVPTPAPAETEGGG